ncbi:nucleoside triphosphate pyrophosphohydrolase [Roseobacter phage CRP-345]|jgi:NTP pyrophosphatase (non-canonical NTP hydrolase)|nr:nucleoside triphosphate pyrophosphohydrolase [Roseobacter phage CRP-345]
MKLEEEAKKYMENKYESLDFRSYQDMAAETAVYKAEHQVIYPALGLAAEAGEVANKVKKILRDGKFDRNAIADEVGDCLWYIAALCRDLNVDMKELAKDNLRKLHDRKARGVIQGSGDKR